MAISILIVVISLTSIVVSLTALTLSITMQRAIAVRRAALYRNARTAPPHI